MNQKSHNTLPGALIIAERLHRHVRDEQFDRTIKFVLFSAEKLEEFDYVNDINKLVIEGGFAEFN